MPVEYSAVATCGFGLESVLSFELKKLGMREVTAHDGRVTFTATGEEISTANIWLRTAERVLIILSSYPVVTFDELFDGAHAVAWGDLIGRSEKFPVKGYSMQSALTSVPACQAILKKALAERLKKDYKTEFLPENGRVTKRIQFSLVKNVCTLMLDTSGDGLHKRGYRPLQHEAPIKETLAAGICDLARVASDSLVADPFCGSGTMLIEAALRAKNVAPGLYRSFAAENYTFFGVDVFQRVREKARASINLHAAFLGRGTDIALESVEFAKKNAERAGVSECLSFMAQDAKVFVPRANEIILANPPYGERMMKEEDVSDLYRAFGRAVKGKEYKGLYMVSNHPEFETIFGKKARRRRKLYNGMLPCQLFMYF